MALMVNPVKPSVPVVLGGLPPPDGFVPFVILVDTLTVSGLLISVSGLFGFYVAGHNAWLPVSSVRMRTACSIELTKIFPSPIFPVRALWATAATACSAWSSGTMISILIFGRKSTVYSLPR
jgi:disulfide bond formation protein DsbB